MSISLLVTLIIVVAAVLAAFLAIRAGYIAQVSRVLLYLVARAESLYGSKTGTLKFSAVSNWLYAQLPPFISLFLPAEIIDDQIELAVDKLKQYLSANANAAALIVSATNEEAAK